ncbi:Cd(II)/Pb(II)-responsive transcriptional regulator [Pseudorhodoferax sp.]|uniref:Cd(II)/Pb(II)-responsive transcriptional regulator n=1 Tax=Pseudorhodoferax sp. TaxID=1993553 RepID=UPI002DD618FF|nr:Cd(II)/Pb(II)-responsive transcriptional regulator [Pseudorhodoferax sp.]
MKIGQLATATDTPVETIRYYERAGLLPAAPRTEGNYRDYADAHVQRLSFIRHCRALDMALDEIRTLLQFQDAPGGDCTGVNALLDAHIGHVAQRIRELRALERQLHALRGQCRDAHPTEDCGILKSLGEEPAPRVHARTRHLQGVH